MKWDILKDYLTFTRKERIGVFLLILLIAVLYVFPDFFPPKKSFYMEAGRDTLFNIIDQRKEIVNADNKIKILKSGERELLPGPSVKMFLFDPNTLSSEGWKSLGIREKTIQTIMNFRSKGGHFKTATEIRKIYGLKKEDADKLIPYIEIRSDNIPTPFIKREDTKKFNIEYQRRDNVQSIDINKADSSDFISLPGIGARLAARILLFRDRLGGFHSTNQIAETYGLSDSTYRSIQQFLLCEEPALQKININTADVSILKQHPYIRWNIANAIVQFREQHGRYVQVNDLLKINIITEEVYNKLAPYIVSD